MDKSVTINKEKITDIELTVQKPFSMFNIVNAKKAGTVAQIWDGAGREKDARQFAKLFAKSPQLLDTCVKLCSHTPEFWSENKGLLEALIRETQDHLDEI